MRNPNVHLTYCELMIAASAGVMRHVENIKLGRQHIHGATSATGFQMDIEGAVGELVVSKYLGVYWNGKGEFRGADVGENEQVRATHYHSGKLCLHKNDDDDKRFWLVTGAKLDYIVRGWLLAKDGKQEQWWTDPQKDRFAYFVPQEFLNDPDS